MQCVDDEEKDGWRTSVNLPFNGLTWLLAQNFYRILEEVHRLWYWSGEGNRFLVVSGGEWAV